MSPNAVLLIEDHPLVSMMLADMLTEHAPDLNVRKVPSIQASEQHVHETDMVPSIQPHNTAIRQGTTSSFRGGSKTNNEERGGTPPKHVLH